MYDNNVKTDSDRTDFRLLQTSQKLKIRDNTGYNRQTEIMTTADVHM